MPKLTNITYRKNGNRYGLDLEDFNIEDFEGKKHITGKCRQYNNCADTVDVIADSVDNIETKGWIMSDGPSFADYIQKQYGIFVSPYGGWTWGTDKSGRDIYIHKTYVHDGHSGENLIASFDFYDGNEFKKNRYTTAGLEPLNIK